MVAPDPALPIYLDYNATTPVDPRVAEAMIPFLTEHFGNPSSGHAFGLKTRRAVENARRQMADLVGIEPSGVVFTSGGTEANNHAIIAAATAAQERGNHIVTSAVEHPAVTRVCRYLEANGFTITEVGVDSEGRVDPEAVAAVLTDRTILVSVMHANNEVGTLQPLADIAERTRSRGILLHSDCAQSVGKVPVIMADLGVDMLSVAGHKLYAPKGVGALCLRPGLELPNLMHGADHEQGRRPGTENVLEIVGLGAAAQLAAEDIGDEMQKLDDQRQRLAGELAAAFPTARINGHPHERLPNTLSISFAGLLATDIISSLPEVAVSAGAACHGDSVTPSHVLKAMGVPRDHALGTLRISVGRMTSEREVTEAITAIVRAVRGLLEN